MPSKVSVSKGDVVKPNEEGETKVTANDSFKPENCPVGIVNGKNVEMLGDRLDMAIERLTEKVSEMKEDISVLSENMNQKFESVDKRFDSMEDKFDKKISELRTSIPEMVDKQLETKKDHSARKILSWVFTGAGGTILISLVTAWIRSKIGV